MLRHYDEIDLLKPSETDQFTGYRYYSEEQLLTVGRITELKFMGFGLTAIREILASYDNKEVLEHYFSAKEKELHELSEQTQQRLRLLETARKRLRKGEKAMKYNVVLKTLPERYVASVRMILPNYEQEGILWSTLMGETAHMNLIADEPCYCYAMFHDREYKESDVDVEVQKTVKGQYPDTEHVKFKTVPELQFASATFKGSYSQMSEVNTAVAEWVRDNGYEFDGPAFDIYHVGPNETSNPEEFVTEVCYPVKKK